MKEVIHCSTLELYRKVLTKFFLNGNHWMGGGKVIDELWTGYGGGTCINNTDGRLTRGSKDFYIEEGFKIIPAEEWLGEPLTRDETQGLKKNVVFIGR